MTNIHKEYQTVQKPFTYALLLAATLALAAVLVQQIPKEECSLILRD